MRRMPVVALAVAASLVLAGCTATAYDPPASPSATIKPGTQAQADEIVQSARVPPTALRAESLPAPTGPFESIGCNPLISSTLFWTVPNMTADQLAAWLKAHPTPPFAFGGEAGNAVMSTGVEEEKVIVGNAKPDPVRTELVFTYAPDGSGLMLRADALVVPVDSACNSTSKFAPAPPATRAP